MAINPITLTAPAKVNLYLGVHEELDERNYHRVDSVMCAINLSDAVTITPAASLEVSCVPEADFPERSNSAYRAAVAMGATFRRRTGFSIVVEKNIPAKSGLGGASADAAAVILGLCAIWGVSKDDPRVEDVARSIGADVPFFLYGRPALLVGAGDVMQEEFPSLDGVAVVIVKPPCDGISAKEAYEDFDAAPVAAADPRPICQALRTHAVDAVIERLSNNLEPVAERLQPQVGRARAWLSEQEGVRRAMVTGSGSCVYGICDDFDTAERIAASADAHDLRAYATTLQGQGPRIVG